MRPLAPAVFVGCLLSVSSAHADGPVDDAVVARQLASADPLVRQAAVVDIVVRKQGDAQRVLALADAAGTAREQVLRARHARFLASRLSSAPRESVAFWSLLERLLAPEWRDLEPAIVLVGTAAGASQRASWLAERDHALAVVAKFCERGAQIPVMGSDPAGEQLAALGPRSTPHLLHILAFDPWSSFWGIHGGAFALAPPGALEQGGAVVAATKTGAREAIPYLLFQLHGPSRTVEWAAASALAALTGQKVPDAGDGEVDDTAVFEWWSAERRSRPESVGDFVEDVLAALLESLPFLEQMPHYAAEYAKFDEPLATTFRAVERISGRTLGAVPSGSLEERLKGIRDALTAFRSVASREPGRK